MEATSQELLQWLLDYASTSDKKDIKAAATRAATIGAAFRLTGGTLRSLPVAALIKFGAGGDTELADAWELIQLRWKAAVDGNTSRPLLCNPALIAFELALPLPNKLTSCSLPPPPTVSTTINHPRVLAPHPLWHPAIQLPPPSKPKELVSEQPIQPHCAASTSWFLHTPAAHVQRRLT